MAKHKILLRMTILLRVMAAVEFMGMEKTSRSKQEVVM